MPLSPKRKFRTNLWTGHHDESWARCKQKLMSILPFSPLKKHVYQTLFMTLRLKEIANAADSIISMRFQPDELTTIRYAGTIQKTCDLILSESWGLVVRYESLRGAAIGECELEAEAVTDHINWIESCLDGLVQLNRQLASQTLQDGDHLSYLQSMTSQLKLYRTA